LKQWYALVCPICGWRHLPRKFSQNPEPITYPVQLVTGGGRARGFNAVRYLPWSALPTLRQTGIWTGLLCLYNRLGAAYDNFYEVLGLSSPKMKTLLQKLRSYEDTYQIGPSHYSALYARTPPDIAESYCVNLDYPETYESLLTPPVT